MPNEHGVGHVLAVVVVAAILVLAIVAVTDQLKPTPPRLDAGQVAKAASPAIVTVESTSGVGTGLVLTTEGEVLTNNHVVAGAKDISVHTAGDGRTYAATVRGYDASHDVAVLALLGASGLPTIALADSSGVKVGDPVVAIGRATTAEAGRVTALHQGIDSGTEHLADMISVDAPTRPSDSGGAILDKNGKAIALITAAPAGARFQQQASATKSFAMPINNIVAIADRIDAGRSVGTVHVGPTATLGASIGANGAVTDVDGASSAARAGITRGAVIVAINYKKVVTPADVEAALSPYAPGDSVRVDWAGTDGDFHSSVVKLTG